MFDEIKQRLGIHDAVKTYDKQIQSLVSMPFMTWKRAGCQKTPLTLKAPRL